MKKTYLPIITILIGTLFQFYYLFSHNILYLIFNTLPDDAFYYFQMARNIAAGSGSTIDGVNLTNGYHPLWMFILVPIYKIFSVGGVNDTAPIYAALCLAVIFSALTALVLYRILTRYTENQKIISFGLFIYLFNPYLLYNVLNGLETSLVLLLLSIFIFLLIKFTENQNKWNLILIGLCGGLLSLARLDMVIVVAVSNLFFLYKYGKNGVNYFFISGITSAILFLTWAIYNFKVFGMYLTSASLTSTFINHRLTYSDNEGESIKVFLKTIVYMLERAVQQITENTGAPIIIISLCGLAIYFAFKDRIIENIKSRNLRPVIFITVGLLALVFVSAGLRWTFRSWYFIPLLLPLSILLVWLMQKIYEDFDFSARLFKWLRGDFLLITLSLLIAFSYFISWDKNLENREILQKTIYEATLWQNENLPQTAHLGVFNAGIQAYFSNHKVTNLDGLVNNQASKAMLNNTLWRYITEVEHIDYVADFDDYMTYRYRESFGGVNPVLEMEKIYTIPGVKDLNIYKVKY